MEIRNLRILVAVLVCLLVLLGSLWARTVFFTELRLIGRWQYSYHDNFYPKYSSELSINSDGTFSKIENYTEHDGAPTAVSTFEGTYVVNGNGLEPGKIAFIFYDAKAKVGGETVATSAEGGFTAICHFAFDEGGHLLITEIADGIRGTRKNPQRLKPGQLIPSWDAYSPMELKTHPKNAG